MSPLSAILFSVLAILLTLLSLRDFVRAGRSLSLAAKIRLRVAAMFALVAVALWFWPLFAG